MRAVINSCYTDKINVKTNVCVKIIKTVVMLALVKRRPVIKYFFENTWFYYSAYSQS